MNVQYKKGVLELLALSLLSGGDRYGYDISENISEKIDISDGAIYPVLRKLKADGMVTAYLSEDSGGPPRKYYKMTALGADSFEASKADWLKFIETVSGMLKTNEKKEGQIT